MFPTRSIKPAALEEFHWSSHMDVALTEQQQMFRDSVASFAREELGTGALERAHTPHFPPEDVLLPAGGFKKQIAGFNAERMGNASRSLAYGRLLEIFNWMSAYFFMPSLFEQPHKR
jgi:hypothetical protein